MSLEHALDLIESELGPDRFVAAQVAQAAQQVTARAGGVPPHLDVAAQAAQTEQSNPAFVPPVPPVCRQAARSKPASSLTVPPVPSENVEGGAQTQRRDPADLLDALEVACRDLPVTPGFVLSALAPEDKVDWHSGNLSADTLLAFATALSWRREMEPRGSPGPAVCRPCGPIWHWREGTYLSCPWCRNRESGRPIPRPPVACRECRHWSPDKINPPGGLGSCAIRTPASKRTGACWPRGEIICADWHPSP